MNDEQINQNARELESEVERIRQNPDLNDEAKQRMMQEAYKGAMNRHRELYGEREQGEQEVVRKIERNVFEVPVPYGASDRDAESIRQSYRDASFRVSGMKQDKLEQVLERAELTGDSILARAVYHEARTQGAFNVADRYLETRPKERKAWEGYAQLRQETESFDRLFRTVSPQRPPELDGGRVIS